MLSGKGDCAHVGAGGGTVGGSSLASGKCSGKGLHNVGQDNTPRLLVKIRLS